MKAYSDRLSHAFAFSAKHYGNRAPAVNTPAYLAHPANVAVILARHDADELTLVASVLHHVLEESQGRQRAELESKIAGKFGPVVLAVAREALEPRYDPGAGEGAWHESRRTYLAMLADASPRALDICAADELQRCGDLAATIRRLGAEYVRAAARVSSEETIWWYRALVEQLSTRPDWPSHALLEELRHASAALLHCLRPFGDPG
ncbi:MAG TPA: HD domain-containing protein [Gemmatimonadales bacterium]|nr:HD domain-containing protein [Gemmatimonadales bacterium]